MFSNFVKYLYENTKNNKFLSSLVGIVLLCIALHFASNVIEQKFNHQLYNQIQFVQRLY